MRFEGSRWYAENSIYRQSVDLVLFQDMPSGSHVGRSNIEMIPHEKGHTIVEPTLSLSEDDAQNIMNEFWRIGIRPQDGNGAVAHTEAIQGHLSDMRKIVASKLKVDL